MKEMIQEFIFHYIIPFFLHWGYIMVLFAAIVESIPFLGIVVPGGSIIILAGVFAFDARLSIMCLILFSAIGAFLGDFIGFYLGKKYGEEILQK